jgi:hypothetical protein
MYGTNLQLIVLRCDVCRMWVALRVDRDDLRRHYSDGVFVQDVFVTADGKPYLSAAERELVLSQTCGDCWSLLCPLDPLAYC